MKRFRRGSALLMLVTILAGACIRRTDVPAPVPVQPPMTATKGPLPPLTEDLDMRLRKLPKTKIDYDRSLLTENEKQIVARLIEAAALIDQIFWRQVSESNPEWRATLVNAARASAEYRKALDLMDIHKGPWDRLDENRPFVLSAGVKREGAGFYPRDMTKEEFESWIAAHPEDKEAFQGLFNVIQRQGDRLVAVPYSRHYNDLLQSAASKLREAASLTTNSSLWDFLNKRASAFLNDDYYESDIAWMDLTPPIEVVIGPYEVYEDELFNYKAAFESFITVVDRPESQKLGVYAEHLPRMEMNLPMPEEHKNPGRGKDSPIKVVQVIYTSGDARRGVQTAAFNLPNDERVREAKGSKKVLLKNVMEAKYQKTGNPIAQRVLDQSQLPLLSFSAFFNHVLFHELSHGLGPGIITGPDGRKVENRILLKETYAPIEEAKADVLGDWNLLYAMNNGLVKEFNVEGLFVTNVGLMFRSMRFGIDQAHGRANAVQWNWYRENGAIVPTADGRFRVDFAKMKAAVESLARELLMIEAIGDYDRAKRLLDRYGRSTAEIDAMNARLSDIPVDIAPVYPAAGE